MHPLRAIRLYALAGLRRVERVFDSAFGSGLNPLRHLGALGFMLFWLLAVSGIYLYVVLDTSAEGAYQSIDQLSREPWQLGGILRSLHRYAADGLIVVTLAHLLREGLYGRYSGFRRFSWLTGIPLLLLSYVNAVGGFWLNWDQLGQFSALATAEWLDWLPLFGSPLTRNFLGADAVSDRLFSLFVFVHIGVPLLLVFGLWFHVQRVARAKVFPPRRLALGTAVTLFALALAAPVTSQGPANLVVAPTALAYDWLLLFVHPLTYFTSPAFVWFALAGALLVLFALPAMPQPAPAPIAVVDADNCNGCRRCFDDCPYAAVTMVPHPMRGVRELAKVDADLCASCGICVGACPSSSPFRSAADTCDRHRHAVGANRHVAPPTRERLGRARQSTVQDRRFRLRPRRRCPPAGRLRCGGLQPDVYRAIAAIVRRVRVARWRRRRAGHRLRRRQLRIPPRSAMDRRAAAGNARAAPPHLGAARATRVGVGRCWRRTRGVPGAAIPPPADHRCGRANVRQRGASPWLTFRNRYRSPGLARFCCMVFSRCSSACSPAGPRTVTCHRIKR